MTVSFDDIMPFFDEKNIVTYVEFDCSFIFHQESRMNIKNIQRYQTILFRPVEKPKCITISDYHICFLDEGHTTNIFLDPYKICDKNRPTFLLLMQY